MNDDLHDFEQFMKRREDAARAYVLGDAAPLGRIVARVSPATFFGPRGGYEQGSEHVYSIYERDATHFTSGDTSFEILHMAASNGIAYWVGFQRAMIRLDGAQNQSRSTYALLKCSAAKATSGSWFIATLTL